MRKLIFIFLLFFLVGCSESVSEDVTWRVNSLYVHTLQMKDISSDDVLKEVGVDASKLDFNEKNVVKRLEILEDSFGVKVDGSFEKRIFTLEERMIIIMDEWIGLQ